MAATAGLFGVGHASKLLAASATARAIRLPLAAQDQVVLDWLRGFASDVRLIGSAVLARLAGHAKARAHWLAAVADLSILPDVLRGAPFAGVYASGSTLSFMVGGCEVTVELLPPDAFAAKLRELARGLVAFDHDSLVFDPSAQTLSDPLRAKATRGLRVTRRGRDVAQAFAQVLAGLIESRQLGLTPSDGFKRYRNQVLGTNGTRAQVADAVCSVLFAQLATWTGAAPVAEIEAVLGSRLVSTSLRSMLGIDVGAAIRAAQAALAGDDAPNPRAWITVLLGPNPNGLLFGGDAFDQLRSRAALALH